MSKVLVIPDMHLKSAILDLAEQILARERIDKIVVLGDLLDDFYTKSEDYDDFWLAFMRFYSRYKNKIVLLYGNHEAGYLLNRGMSGTTKWGEKYAAKYAELSPKVVHLEDKITFSHAGVFDEFLRMKDLADLPVATAIEEINALPLQNLWFDESPLWARPQYRFLHNSGEWLGCTQVIGHTPMRNIDQCGTIISADVFSTDWGKKYGEEKMVVINSKTGKFTKHSLQG